MRHRSIRALKALLELRLAQSYRQTRQFYEAESYAQHSEEDADSAAGDGVPAKMPVAQVIEGPSSGAPLAEDPWSQWPLVEIQAVARAELAGCHADRYGISLASDSDAALCDRAEELACDLEGFEANEVQSEVLTERGRIELVRRELELAHGDRRMQNWLCRRSAWLRRRSALKVVNLLEQATQKDPTSAGSYVALALAYERLARDLDDGEAALAVKMKRARDSCERAKEIVADPHHRQWAAAHGIEQRLDASQPARPAH